MFKVKVNKVLQVKEIADDLKEAFEALIEVNVLPFNDKWNGYCGKVQETINICEEAIRTGVMPGSYSFNVKHGWMITISKDLKELMALTQARVDLVLQ